MAKQREARLYLEANQSLSLRRLHGREEVSRPFHYDLLLLGSSHDLDLDKLLGTGITVEIEGTEGTRMIHGLVADTTYRGEMEDQARYDVVLVPWLWFLDRRVDCRIFQNMTAIQIVKSVVGEHHGDLEDRLTGQYLERDYCVQYRESDLNFVCRLLEEEGVFFYFEHSRGRHAMILVDEAASCPTRPGYATVPFYPPTSGARRERDHLDRWQIMARARTAHTALRSFDFKQPGRPLEAVDQAARLHDRDNLEAYDYPGDFVTNDAGDTRARVRLEALRAERRRVSGAGNATGLACGHRFTLRNFPRVEQNAEHLVLAVDTMIEIEPQRTASAGVDEPYQCAIEAMGTKVPFRPARVTPRPFVHGPQTAIVTGPAGEEIYTDQYGRVKVQFHWDRQGKSDANSSCWLRVSQAWAGAGYGAMQIPRIGQEVIVDFLEGDPDQPIITGRVYNAHQMPPNALPAGAVKSGFKSNSTKGGGGSNELTFDDTKGSEKAYFHAQYDSEAVIEHDETRHIKNNQAVTIDGTQTKTIKGKTSITVTEGDYSHTVSSGTATVTVKGKVTETFQDAQATTVTQSITVVSGTSCVHVTAATDIVLEVGLSKLSLFSDGRIELSGKAVAIKGTDAVNISGKSVKSDAGNDHSISGAIVMSSGSVSNTVKGTMVMLNP